MREILSCRAALVSLLLAFSFVSPLFYMSPQMLPVLLAPLFVIFTLTISDLARSVNNHFRKLLWREKLEDSGLSHFRKPMISFTLASSQR